MPLHRVYLIPGLFGFASLAGYDYFEHLERAIAARFLDAGMPLELHLVPSLPTASITARAVEVAGTVARTSGNDEGPIHLVGHSSGGLDARLLLSPGSHLAVAPEALAWTRRVRTVVSLNTPHHGTPLAAYFSTISGTRMLYALSLLTVTGLSVGQLPLAALAAAVTAVRAVDDGLGLDIQLIDELTDGVLRFVGERGRGEIQDFLRRVQKDQSGIVQLMPEVAELFNAAVSNRPGVRYGCTVSSAPAPKPSRVFGAALSPVAALQLAIYTTLYGVASRADARYPYATPDAQQRWALRAGIRREVGPDSVDGVVPTLSMLWGELLWCGAGDHHDVVGHFSDDEAGRAHVDWLRSGADFSRADFAALVDSLCRFLLA